MIPGDKVWCSCSGSFVLRREREWIGKVEDDRSNSGWIHVVRKEDGSVENCDYVKPAIYSLDEFIDAKQFRISGGYIYGTDGKKVSVQDAAAQGKILSYVDPCWIEGNRIVSYKAVHDPVELANNYLKLLEAGDVR